MYVRVAHLSFTVYNELSAIMSRKNEPKAVQIHFRRLEVRNFSLTKNKQDYYSDSLFSDNDIPCRLIVCFVDASAKIGNYHKNPFNFPRKWVVPKSNLIESSSNSSNLQDIEARFLNIEKKLAEFTAKFFVENETQKKENIKSKGKGRGKRSKPSDQSSISSNESSAANDEAKRRQEISNEARNHLRRFFESQGISSSEQQPQGSQPFFLQDDPPDPPIPTTKTIFLRKVECQLNSTPIDQIEDDQTEDECVQSFWRLFATNGLINTIHSNNLDYDDFKNGYYFACFDLSTSGHCGTNYVIPSMRVGHLRLHVQFSEPLPVDMTMLLFCEFPSTLFIHKSGKVTTRYFKFKI